MILNDRQITELAKQGMIEPFLEERLQPFGYDITLSTKFKIFRGRKDDIPIWRIIKELWNWKGDWKVKGILDPFNARESDFEEFEGPICTIPPQSFALGTSMEYFRMPDDVVGQCLGRSSYARMGINSPVSPIEAGWSGNITIEIFNITNMPNLVYANKGISQVQFHKGEVPEKNYVQKGGRYNNQVGVTLARGA